MKYQILFIVLISSLLCLTHQASLYSHHTLTPRYNQSAYADELAKRQQQFQKRMKEIENQVADLDSNISKLQGNDTYQIMKLQQGLADERDALYDVESSLNQPFALKPCSKPNLTEQQKLELTKQIKLTNDSLADMQAQVKQCTEQAVDKCTVTDELIHQITRAQLYLSVMDDYVNGNCKRVPRTITDEKATGLVDLNDRLYKDNLKAPNWVYGNITEEQYRLIVFSQTTKFNMTTCPIDTPFANKVNNTCFNCPEGSIFSLGERVCTCETGFKFDQETNECVSLTPIKPCNETGSCVSMCPKDKPRWNSVNKICEECPVDKPVVNRTTSTCESCPQLTPIWNQLTYQCQPCPKNTHFVPNVSKCVPCKDEEKYDQTLKKCVPICKPYQVYNKQQGKCYTLEQLNGCKCNQRYNTTLKQCEDVCDHGLQWLPADRKCGPPALPEFKDKCKYYQRLNKDTNECENYCDSTVAFYDRSYHVCVKIGCSVECKCGEIFDNLTGKCIPESHQCSQGQFYNTTSGECQIFCKQGFVYNRDRKTCEVPTVPIPTPTKTCAFDQLLNQQTNQCVKRCSDPLQFYNTVTGGCDCQSGYHVDPSTLKCVQNQIFCDPALHLTLDPSQNRCICTQGFTLDQQNTCISLCPSSQNKYYNPATKTCSCLQGYTLSSDQVTCLMVTCLVNQHFDYNRNQCVCDDGFVLNANDGQCYKEKKQCNEALHFVLNPLTNQCECASGFRLNADGSSCSSLAEICIRNPNTIFNPATSSCQCLPGFTPFNQTNDFLTCQAICKVDQTFNPSTNQCVPLCPFDYYYNTTTHSCIYRCSVDYQFNNSTKQCQRLIKTCPDPINQFYDAKSGQCHYCPTGYTLNQVTLLCQKKTITCASGQFLDQATGTCQYCRAGQVYNTVAKVCQFTNTTCSNGMYFDFNLGQCQYCPQGYVYDDALLSCRNNCTVDQIYDYTKKQCMLISYTCSEYQYYDAVTRKCVNKPICSTLQRYDEVSRKCIDINFITSKTAKNLVHSNSRSYETYYDGRKAADQYLRDCPQETPFYSTSAKNCVFCPTLHPYFNLQAEKCQDCGNDNYDANLRRCFSLNQPAPDTNPDLNDLNYSLDRLVMNIV